MDQEVKKLAKQYFEAYPKEDTLFITTDNQVFLTSNRGDAVNHQRYLDVKQSVRTVTRLEVASGDVVTIIEPDASWTVPQIIDFLKQHIEGFEAKGLKKDNLLAVAADVVAKQKAAVEPDATSVPDATWEEEAIISWLKEKSVDADGTKDELLAKVAEVIAKSNAQ
jgi:hypothetical protein